MFLDRDWNGRTSPHDGVPDCPPKRSKTTYRLPTIGEERPIVCVRGLGLVPLLL